MAPETQATEYVILVETGGSWTVNGTATASSASAAIRKFLDGKTEVDGIFVAIPTRSWKPVPVKTRIALDFGEAS